MKKFLLIAVGLFFVGSANATLITSNTTNITTTQQSFSTVVNLLDTYENIFLNVTAKGDYGATQSEEFLKLYIDGVELLNWCAGSNSSTSCPNVGVTSVTENSSAIDYTIIGGFAISDLLWSAFSSDSILNISWNNGRGVNNSSTGGSDFVTYSITGDVVEASSPAVISLFVLALAGFGFTRRNKNK